MRYTGTHIALLDPSFASSEIKGFQELSRSQNEQTAETPALTDRGSELGVGVHSAWLFNRRSSHNGTNKRHCRFTSAATAIEYVRPKLAEKFQLPAWIRTMYDTTGFLYSETVKRNYYY
jgi:hypothetical protein